MGNVKGKFVVAMSGGVDSSVAACLLAEQGYEVVGVFMCMGMEEEVRAAVAESDDEGEPRRRSCCSLDDSDDARAVARRFGFPFSVLNFKDQFDRLIEHFADEYSKGRTPNPCPLCNQFLKFGKLADFARSIGAGHIATGHYARIMEHDGQFGLYRGVDNHKDQSYALFGLAREVLPMTLFPIGGLTKDEVRACAQKYDLAVSEKPDSQDICFAPDGNYARIVRQRRPEAFEEGAIIDDAGNEVGRHEGIAHYTIGQRRGLGIAMGTPRYVTGIDPANKTVRIGTGQHLAADSLTAASINWLVDPPTEPIRVTIKIRYAHAGAPGTVDVLPDGRARVQFDEAVRAVTPGQAAVFYDDQRVLGGGWIERPGEAAQ